MSVFGIDCTPCFPVIDSSLFFPAANEFGIEERLARLESVRQMRVAFGIPKRLGTLKAGDKVRCQVMYSPAPIREAAEEPFHDVEYAPITGDGLTVLPQLSSSIDLTVTKAILEMLR